MVTPKEPPTEERAERTTRVPKSQTPHGIRVRVPRAGSKQRKPLMVLIVEAGIARSVDEARAMLIAGEICHDMKGSEYQKNGIPEWSHGEPLHPTGATPSVGSMKLDEDARILHRSKCPECRSKPIVFAKKDRKPAISSTTHSRVLEGVGGDDELLSSDSTIITQENLEAWIFRRRQFTELDEPIAIALSKGATVEEGVHTAELIPARAEDGSVHLKLVVR